MRADSQVYTLATGASSNGAGVPVRGGRYMFLANGTAGGATITLQIQQPDQATWSTVAIFNNSAVSSTTLPYSQTGVDLPASTVRMGVSGGTPSGLNAWLAGIG